MKTVLRVAKLKTPGNIGGLNAHNTRTMDVPNADEDLQKYNHRLVGSSNLNQDVQARLDSAGITKVRSNGVRAIEHVISASPEFFGAKKIGEGAEATLSLRSPQESKEFFKSAKEWLEEHYGAENLVNFTVHYDEKTPHAHAVVVPITPEGKLAAKKLIGSRELLSNMQSGFAKSVEHLGIDRGREGSKARHQTLKEFYSKVEEADEYFKGMDQIAAIDLDEELSVKAFQAPVREKNLVGMNKLSDEEYSKLVQDKAQEYSSHVVDQVQNIYQAKFNEMEHFTVKLAQIDVEAKKQRKVIKSLEKDIKDLKTHHKGEIQRLKQGFQEEKGELERENGALKKEKDSLVKENNSLRNQIQGIKDKFEKDISALKEDIKRYLLRLSERVKLEMKIFKKAQFNDLKVNDVKQAFINSEKLDKAVDQELKNHRISTNRGRSI